MVSPNSAISPPQAHAEPEGLCAELSRAFAASADRWTVGKTA
jgi:hypothetical protein